MRNLVKNELTLSFKYCFNKSLVKGVKRTLFYKENYFFDRVKRYWRSFIYIGNGVAKEENLNKKKKKEK